MTIAGTAMRSFLLGLYLLSAALVIWDENAAATTAEPATTRLAAKDRF